MSRNVARIIQFLFLIACVRQAPSASGSFAKIDGSLVTVSVMEDRGRFEAPAGPDAVDSASRHMATCAGIYVAPHLVATSVEIYAAGLHGRALTPTDVALDDGGPTRGVDAVAEFDRDSGLVLLRTDEVGKPIPTRTAPLEAGEALTYIRHRFRIDRRYGGVDIQGIDSGPATYEWTTARKGERPSYDLVRMPMRAGLCGAVILDSRGQLVGIAMMQGSGRVGVLPVKFILARVRDATIAH